MRLSGSYVSIFFIKSIASLDTYLNSGTNIRDYPMWSSLTVHIIVTDSDFSYYFSVIFSIEGRSSTQENVKNDPDAPNIALFIVVRIQYLRCYIIGSSKCLTQLLFVTFLILEPGRCSEVNDLDYVIILWVQ